VGGFKKGYGFRGLKSEGVVLKKFKLEIRK
jgi:hypothetical protein